MHTRIARWARVGGLAALVSASVALGAAEPVHSAAMYAAAAAPARATASDVTEQDVAASNAKVKLAYDALVSMWSADFAQLGTRFAPPGLVRYRGAVRTACGVMSGNNAAYCPGRNTIYFDDVFVARQAKDAARDLGTDGDMAAVGIIAHQMGHAVAMQRLANFRTGYEHGAGACVPELGES
jgi:Predicted metalloprotease